MKSFQIVTLLALVASAMAFSPNQLPQGRFYFCRYVDVTTGSFIVIDYIRRLLDGFRQF
jgi:hypothetical protein